MARTVDRFATIGRLLRNPAQAAYCGTALALVVLTPLGYARFPRWDFRVSLLGMACFAALSCLFALIQAAIPLRQSWKSLLGWSWLVGIVLLMTGWPWWHELVAAWAPDPRWRRTLGMVDLALPVLILLPVGALLLGVLRCQAGWRDRTYLLGGLSLMVLFLAQTWVNLFEIWVAQVLSTDWFMAALFWMPVALVVATIGMLLGCQPPDYQPRSWAGSLMAVCYLAAVAMVPLGFWANLAGRHGLAEAAALLVTVGVFAPAATATRSWILSRSGKR